jgi:hypothetical protein
MLFISLLFGFSGNAKAVVRSTCTWTGAVSSDWALAGNWDCGHAPLADEDVIIPDVTRDPVYLTSPILNSITINLGGALFLQPYTSPDARTWTIDGTLYADTGDWGIVYINSEDTTGTWVVNVSSTGNITNQNTGGLIIQSPCNIAGSVYFPLGGFTMDRSGTHTGSFQGVEMYLGRGGTTGQTINFNIGSQLNVNKLFITEANVNINGIYGTFSTPLTGSKLSLANSSSFNNFNVTVKSSASVTNMPETTEIFDKGRLVLESETSTYSMPKLSLNGGILENQVILSITNQLDWSGGGFAGAGTTNVISGAAYTIRTGAHTIDEQTLVNNTTANWTGGNITLSNGAVFENNSIFNANATTLMTGGTTESFINNSSFFKNTNTTTTTINTPFTNNGTVEVIAGSLVFQQGIETGEDSVIDLGGSTFDPGDTLTLGSDDSLVGSGTLSASLVNGGTVSPGNSTGIITIDGDYTQEAGGTLVIELGGTSPGTGYDQLVVTGTATMGGTLDVSLLPEFTPEIGQVFYIITHNVGNFDFDTVNLQTLPGGLKLEIAYSDPDVTLTVVEGGDNFTIFLPLIVR